MKHEADTNQLLHFADRFPKLLDDIKSTEHIIVYFKGSIRPTIGDSRIPMDDQFVRGMKKASFAMYVTMKKSGVIFEAGLEDKVVER